MNPEERSLLERTYKLSEENNELLKSIRLSNRISLAMRIVYWVVILGFSFGAVYFIKPYVEFLSGAVGINGTSNTEGIVDTLKVLQDSLK
jgi:hypothetical protein